LDALADLEKHGLALSPRSIARLLAHVSRFCPEKGLDEPKERAPALHRPPKIVHRLGVGVDRVLDGGPCLGEDVAGRATQR
jgi:hypothetical protein